MALWVKYKHEGLCSDLKLPHRSWVWSQSSATSSLGGRERQILGLEWPGNLAEIMSSGFRERPCFQRQGGEQEMADVSLWPLLTRVHTQANRSAHKCIHTFIFSLLSPFPPPASFLPSLPKYFILKIL